MFNWFLINKEWIFSGIGIPTATILARYMYIWHLNSHTINSEPLRVEIEKAVFEMRDITNFNLVWTGLRNDNHFFEFSLQDFSETWLIQEIPKSNLTTEIKRQIKIVNRHLNGCENRHQSVLIILLVYRKLSERDKAYLFSLLQLFKETESLSPKIMFNIWDKSSLAVKI
jgi:hypothetical protein